MKFITKLICLAVLFFSITSCQHQKVQCISLDGTILNSEDAGKNRAPYLNIHSSDASKGTFFLYPSKATKSDSIIGMLNQLGYTVATLKGGNIQIADALKAFQLIKSDTLLKLNTNYTGIIGYGAGAKWAALTVNKLKENQRPEGLILINPKGFKETSPGTVFPIVNPPLQTKTKLLAVTDSLILNNEALKAVNEYTKTWIGYDGVAFYKTLNYTQNKNSANKELKPILASFLNNALSFPKETVNPAAEPVEGYSPERHAEKVADVKNQKYDLLFVGNSITNNWEKPEYQTIWKRYFGSRNAINLGFSGYRTENIIWNIKNGELKGQTPKVIILEIGTNNIDENNYPTRHTAGQLAGGIEEIVNIFREQCPDSKIILLRCFPGCYGGPNPTSHRRILERASDMVSKLADNKHIYYCDVNHIFLNMDGSIKKELMPDWLHPNPAGAELWAQAMEPLLSELMEDKSRNEKTAKNTAIIPRSKLENDSYNWWDRHKDVLDVKDALNPEIVLIGNSITHFWGGNYPKLKYADGTAREPNGPNSWSATFGNHRVLNLGFGWDRTQNVLWRLDHGELDALDPELVIIHIGTNNTSKTEHARMNTATEIIEGIKAIVTRVRSKVPRAKIVLMQIMPREEQPNHPRRILINDTNQLLIQFAEKHNITLLDISEAMLTPDGVLTKEFTLDFCHPTDAGYNIWGQALQPYISKIE